MEVLGDMLGPLWTELTSSPDAFEWRAGVTPLSTWEGPAVATAVYLGGMGLLRLVCGAPLPRGSTAARAARDGGQGGSAAEKAARRPLTVVNALLALHNIVLMLASVVMFVGCALALHARLTGRVPNVPELHGVFEVFCDPDRLLARGGVFFWSYVFYVSKYWELLDSVFVLVKRQELLFLQVYHHIVTMWLAWVGMDHGVSLQFLPLLFNTFVHILMYYNYAVTALGGHVPWKKHLTRLQMVQFAVNFGGVVAWLVVNHSFSQTDPRGCAGTVTSNYLCLAVQLSFFILFKRFMAQRYRRPATTDTKKTE